MWFHDVFFHSTILFWYARIIVSDFISHFVCVKPRDGNSRSKASASSQASPFANELNAVPSNSAGYFWGDMGVAAVLCGFPLETRTVRLTFSVGDLFASTKGKIVVWDGIPVVMLNTKILHLFWNQPKKHSWAKLLLEYFLMVQFFLERIYLSQAPLLQIIDRWVIYHCPKETRKTRCPSTGDPIERNPIIWNPGWLIRIHITGEDLHELIIKYLAILLMEEILHHLTCMKPCK